jgi:hypothetical protein
MLDQIEKELGGIDSANNNKIIYFNCAFSKLDNIKFRYNITLSTIPGANER